jgi:hypothetical protein
MRNFTAAAVVVVVVMTVVTVVIKKTNALAMVTTGEDNVCRDMVVLMMIAEVAAVMVDVGWRQDISSRCY